jgi:hypothetical protein
MPVPPFDVERMPAPRIMDGPRSQRGRIERVRLAADEGVRWVATDRQRGFEAGRDRPDLADRR